MLEITINLDPCPKPRMTQSDRWKNRPATTKYWKFKDDLLAAWGNRPVPETMCLLFVIEMPRSWPKNKRMKMIGKPHQSRPDVDNLTKSVLDSLLKNDAHIWDIRSTKIWGESGLIHVQELEPFKIGIC